MSTGKKFIAPGGWFAMTYPLSWSEYEDSEDCFLFYNPDEWTGNFRISAYRGDRHFADTSIKNELHDNESARRIRVGAWDCAYSKEMFEEEGRYYVSHLWVTGRGDLVFEISFTVPKGGDVAEAEQVIASLEPREPDAKYPAEIIPARLSEVYAINEAYEWVSSQVKELLKVDFVGSEADVAHMQQLVEQLEIAPKKKDVWLKLGIVLCVIMANEADGLEWRTLIDGNREAPILVDVETGEVVDPMKLVWSRVKAGEAVDLVKAYKGE